MKIHFWTLKGRRKTNQDAHTIFNNINGNDKSKNDIIILGCYDGHGEEVEGKGDCISKFLSNNIPEIYGNLKYKYPFNDAFHKKVFEILQRKCLENKESYRSGSTCVISIIYKYDGKLIMEVINLGDSRCGIIYKNNKFLQITEDNSPDNPKERQRIESMGGKIIKDSYGISRINGLSVSCGIGDSEINYISHKPDIFRKIITNDIKYIILNCDGLVESLTNEDIVKYIHKYKKSNNVAKELALKAYKKGSDDNISVIILEF